MTRLVGTLTLATGSGLLLSGPLIGQDLLLELVGESAVSLRLICIIAIVLGLLATALGIREEREITKQSFLRQHGLKAMKIPCLMIASAFALGLGFLVWGATSSEEV